MGLNHSAELRSLANHLSPGQRWNVVSKEANKNVVKSPDGLFADEYSITIEPYQSVKSELEMYSYRKAQDLPLVKVIAAEIVEVPSSPGLCSGGMHSHGRILTERIKYVLSDAPQMGFPEALYCLSEAMVGFRHLHQKVGPFQITDRMIGMTPEGFVKVWMNDNFAMNSPSIERMSPFTTTDYLPTDNPGLRSEVQMVKDLLKAVEYHTENGQFPNDWELDKLSRPHLTFIEANRLIQNYVSKHSIFVPDRLSEGKIVRITRTPIQRPKATVTETVTTTIVETEAPPVGVSIPPIAPVMVETQVVENIKPLTPLAPVVNVATKENIHIQINGKNFARPLTPTGGIRPSSYPVSTTAVNTIVQNQPPVFIGPPGSHPMRKTRVLLSQHSSQIPPPPPSPQNMGTVVRASQKSTPSVQSPVRKSTPVSSAVRNSPPIFQQEVKASQLPQILVEESQTTTIVEPPRATNRVLVRQVESIPISGTVTGLSMMPSHVSIINTEHSSESSVQAFIPGPPIPARQVSGRISNPPSKIMAANGISPNKDFYMNRDTTEVKVDKPPSVLISGISEEAPSRIEVAEVF